MSETPHTSPLDAVAEEAALYTLGLLEGKARKSFESRLRAGCPVCQAETEASACVLGEAAAASLPTSAVEPPPGLRARLMAQVAGKPESGRDMRVVRGGEEGWVNGPVAGSHFKPLDGAHTFLLRLEPGVTYPAHEHNQGAEQCLVLGGSLDCAGVHVNAGDYIAMPQGSFHEEFRSAEGCLLLIAYS